MTPTKEQGKMKAKKRITITPKNKKLLKSPKIRKYIKAIDKVINNMAIKNKWMEKIQESVILGAPLLINKDGKVKVMKELS